MTDGRRGRVTWLPVVLGAVVALLTFYFFGTTPADEPSSPPATSSTSASTTASTSASPSSDGLPSVDLADLPPEAADTVQLIDDGGPYPYDQDDGVFGNFEGLLPDQPRGYYREYTVETPGSDDRGARRIVGGSQGELYWTADHYQSFERIER